jgi:hypothetical protein
MLLRGSSSRGARGQSPNRSRGSRGGRGSSRGASSSSKFGNGPPPVPLEPRALRDKSNEQFGCRRDSAHSKSRLPKSSQKHAYSKKFTGTSSANIHNPFELERLENAARREQRGRGQNVSSANNGRGAQYPRGNNQVRFNNAPLTEKKESATSRSSSPTTINPFATSNSSAFGIPSTPAFNPFAAAGVAGGSSKAADQTTEAMPFGTPIPATFNPFARPAPQGTGAVQTAQTVQTSTVFGAPSVLAANPFGGPETQTLGNSGGIFGSQQPQGSISGFGAPLATFRSPSFGGFQQPAMATVIPLTQPATISTKLPGSLFPSIPHAPSYATPVSPFGSSNPTPKTTSSSAVSRQSGTNGFVPPRSSIGAHSKSVSTLSSATGPPSSSAMATKVDELLQKEGINAPTWPTSSPGDPKQKAAIEAFWQTSKKYRQRVRISLIKAGLLDDPEKPKKLSEAIDFKGTCEDMCPEFEKITRIMEHDVREPEKDLSPDGSLWPSLPKMIKALARSAAGQDAPLPMDVRSPAALRRTLDYLLHNILGEEEGRLPAVHGFLWDRTRAIRRDFVFQSSMSPTELFDQVYCLERITRFHVIALHQMSMEGIEAEDFSEQQEVEQLGKSLLSLIHAYEDCQAQGILCENESEFRAYYVLFNSHNTGILETVQDWGWKFWGESQEIKIAVSLVETLQNTWDTRGPLKPHSATNIAQNTFSRFFSIIEDRKVSYPMACFAEIHFNEVRKSALKAIFAAYRLQRAPTKDWTLSRLNNYLWFDDKMDIVPFAKAYGLHIDDNAGEGYLSFESDDTIFDPFPPLKQRHSEYIVERKRGNHSLPEVIDQTVYDENESDNQGVDTDQNIEVEGLFVKDEDHVPNLRGSNEPSQSTFTSKQYVFDVPKQPAVDQPASISETTSNLTSIFDQNASQQSFPRDFFSKKLTEAPTSLPPGKATSSTTSTVQTGPVQSILGPSLTQDGEQSRPSSFSFPQPTWPPPPAEVLPSSGSLGISPDVQSESPKSSPNLGSHTETVPAPSQTMIPSITLGAHAISAPPTTASTSQLFLGNQPVTAPIQPPAGINPGTEDQSFEQQTGTPQFRLPESPQGIGASKPTSLKQLRHEQPQMQAHSLILSPTQLESDSQNNISSTATFDPPRNKMARLNGFSEWVALGDGGLVDQYIEFTVENLLREAVETYVQDETRKATRNAEEEALRAAYEFRYQFLATKYCNRWRSLAHLLWLKRKGRNAREARKQYAEGLRASKLAQSANVVEDFKASTKKTRRNSLESLLDSTGVLNGVHDSGGEIRAIAQGELRSTRKREVSRQSTISLASKTSTRKRGKPEKQRRHSLLSDPSYLTGGSRIHLMPNYSARDEDRKQVSGVRTDYFRLKARGITTLPDGTPLASSVAKNILRKKHSFDNTSRAATPSSSRIDKVLKSAPIAMSMYRGEAKSTAEREEDFQVLKSRAQDVMAENKMAVRNKSKRSFDGEDEELFERAKRVREQLDEGAGWYRKEIERETVSRSMS